MECSLRDRTKALVNSILLCYPKGLPLERFIQEYSYQEKQGLLFKEMGFDSPLGLLSSMTDVVKCIKVPSGQVVLQAVSNKVNEHLHEMVTHQKNRNNKSVKKVTSLLSGQSHDLLIKVEPKEEPIDRDDPFVWKEKTPRSMTPYQYEHFLCETIIEILSMEPLSLTFDEIYDIFLNKYQHAIELSRLEYSSPKQFFEAHENLFNIQEQNGQVMISLQKTKQRPPWALTPIDVPITSIYLGAQRRILQNLADPKHIKDPRLIRDPVLHFEQSESSRQSKTPVIETPRANLADGRSHSSSIASRSQQKGNIETNQSRSNQISEPANWHPAAVPPKDPSCRVEPRPDQTFYQPPSRNQSSGTNSQPQPLLNNRDPRLKRNSNSVADMNRLPRNAMNGSRQGKQSSMPLHNPFGFQSSQNVVNLPTVFVQPPVLQPGPLLSSAYGPFGNLQMPVQPNSTPILPFPFIQTPVGPMASPIPGNHLFGQVPSLVQLSANRQSQSSSHQQNLCKPPENAGSFRGVPPLLSRDSQRTDVQSSNGRSGRLLTSENPFLKKHIEKSLNKSKLSVFGRKPTVTEPSVHSTLPPTFGVAKPKQKDVWTSSVELKYQELPPEASIPFEYFFVIVGEVYTPAKFYWFLKDNREVIEKLSDDMTVFYRVQSSLYDMKREEMYVGQIVAALYTDQLFYRARILSFQAKQAVEVFYIDYGSRSVVDSSHIYHLHLQYTQLPIQGFCGRLFGIIPPNGSDEWPEQSNKTFLNLVKDSKPLAASVFKKETVRCEKETETVYVISLTDTTGDEDLHIGDRLYEEKLATDNLQEQKELEDIFAPFAGPTEDTSSSAGVQPPTSPTQSSLADAQPHTPMEIDDILDTVSSLPTPQLSSSLEPKVNEKQVSSPLNRSSTPIFQTPNTTPAVSPTESLRESRPPALRRRYIKPVGLNNGQTLHIFKLNDQLYLSGVEMANLSPVWGKEATMEESFKNIRLRVDSIQLNIKSEPSILLECAKLDIPWLLKEDGQFVENITLYPLKIISSVLFIFEKNDPDLNRVLDSQLKALDDPYWS